MVKLMIVMKTRTGVDIFNKENSDEDENNDEENEDSCEDYENKDSGEYEGIMIVTKTKVDYNEDSDENEAVKVSANSVLEMKIVQRHG